MWNKIIGDAIKAVNEAKQEPEIIEDIIEVEQSSGTSSTDSIEF